MLNRVIAVVLGLALLAWGGYQGLYEGEIRFVKGRRFNREPVVLYSGNSARWMGGFFAIIGAGFIYLGLSPHAMRKLERKDE